MILEKVTVGQFQVNAYIVGCEKTYKAAIIDPGDDPETIIKILKDLNIEPDKILLTHGHMDHVGGVAEIKEVWDCEVCIHNRDSFLLDNLQAQAFLFNQSAPKTFNVDRIFNDSERLQIGELEINVLETPGHTPGGVCYYLPGYNTLFTGDTLFHQSIGRTDLPGGDHQILSSSIHQKLLVLADETRIYAGHGPDTILYIEKKNNPYI